MKVDRMNMEFPVDRRASLRCLAANRSLGLWILLAALLVAAGTAHGDAEPEPKKPKKAAAKKSETRKSKIDAAGAEGPGSDHPEWPLALWSDGPAVEWRLQAYACAVEAEKLVTTLEKARTDVPIKKRIAAVDRAHVLNLQLSRLVALITPWSETAAVELTVRRDQLSNRLGQVVAQIRSENGQLISDLQAVLRERCQKAQKNLDSIKKMREAGKFEVAEARLIKLFDDLATDGAWYPSVDDGAPLLPFERLLAVLAKDLLPRRQQAARDAMNRYRDQQMPNYAELIAQVGAATAAATAGRKFDDSGKMRDVPQALELFLGRWQDLHFKTMHVRAMDCALANDTSLRDDPATIKPYAKFEQDIVAALVKLIDADAVKAAEVAPHYAAYVHALAPTLSLATDDSCTRQFQAALDRLAEKSPPLVAQLDTYRLATSDMLRWRARLAAARRARTEPRQAAVTTFQGTLNASAPAMIRSLSPELVGRLSVGQDLIGTPASQRAASAMAKNQSYCVVPLDARLQAAGASLRAALLSADSAEPLSLDAAMALVRAERGDLAAVGGPVKRIELESVVPLWAHADTWGPTRLERQPGPVSEPMCLRIELEPRWYYQTHAFVEIEPGKP